ncbi:hypothetical protein AKJ09_08992 [Labilithrix luteola]|uniref:Uncharacterized protein n=1 Tax=Labilithrix luteola TaxID=1391654 RepID=A0A0K1Q9B9_9BACT|nr:hypothetical protein [Labilithrix luteola]AKV02329.1 hypothetical protein AKJ09_08992 [Labilithrix luteola]
MSEYRDLCASGGFVSLDGCQHMPECSDRRDPESLLIAAEEEREEHARLSTMAAQLTFPEILSIQLDRARFSVAWIAMALEATQEEAAEVIARAKAKLSPQHQTQELTQ